MVLSPTAVSYNMAQLSASTEYSVKLQAIAGPKRSRVITTIFTTSEWTDYSLGGLCLCCNTFNHVLNTTLTLKKLDAVIICEAFSKCAQLKTVQRQYFLMF